MGSLRAQAALTRLLFYSLIVIVAATSFACVYMAEAAAHVEFFLYGFVPFALAAVFGMHVLLCRTPGERRLVEFAGLITLAAVLIAMTLFALERRALVLYAGASLATLSVILQLRFVAASRDRIRYLRIIRLQESLIVPMAVPAAAWVLAAASSMACVILYRSLERARRVARAASDELVAA